MTGLSADMETLFDPIHSAVIEAEFLLEIAALLETHPNRAKATTVLDTLGERCGSGDDPARAKAYREGADSLCRDGEIEVDEGAAVSMGNDGGAYVQAWLWVSDERAGLAKEEG